MVEKIIKTGETLQEILFRDNILPLRYKEGYNLFITTSLYPRSTDYECDDGTPCDCDSTCDCDERY